MESTENAERFIRDFTDNAEKFYRRLRGTRDNNSRVQQQQIEFIAHTKAFITAWRTFALVYCKVPAHPAFEHLLHNLLNDNRQIIASLSQKLANATLANKRRERSRGIFHFFHPIGILGAFFGYGETCLRQKQILYATAVVNLIVFVVMHVKNHGFADSSDNYWHGVQRDQLDTIHREQHAMKALRAQERHFRDDLVHSHNWLGGFQWTGEPECLPLETAAKMWFHVTSSNPSIAGSHNGPQGSWLDHILAQVDARCQELEESWNHRWTQQQAEWQKLVDRLEEQKEELQRELQIVKQEREDLMRDVERLQNRSDEPEPKFWDADEAILAIEVEQDLVEAEKRGLDEDRPGLQHERWAPDAEEAVPFHKAQQTPETSDKVMDVPPTLATRGRMGLPLRHPVASNKSRFPPATPVKLNGGKRRDSTPDARPRSSSRGSHASSLATDLTLVNSISASSSQTPRTSGHARVSPTSRTGSQHAGVTMYDLGTSGGFQRGHHDSYQQSYDIGPGRTSQYRSSSSRREYEDPYHTLPQQHGVSNSAGHEAFYPQVDAIGKQYNSQPSFYVPQYIPATVQRSAVQTRRQNSYQESAPLTIGRLARV